MKITICLEPSKNGATLLKFFHTSLPGCISEVDIQEEVLRNIKEATGLYLESVEASISIIFKGEVELTGTVKDEFDLK